MLSQSEIDYERRNVVSYRSYRRYKRPWPRCPGVRNSKNSVVVVPEAVFLETSV